MNVVETALRLLLVTDGLVERQRIRDPPARIRIDPDEFLVFGRDLIRIPVPGKPALVEAQDFLNPWQLEVKSRFGDGVPDRLAELSDDHLFGLMHGKERARDHQNDE